MTTDAVLFRNRELSAKFEVESDDQVIKRFKSMDQAKELGDQASEKNFKQVVARAAFGGLPTTLDAAKDKLSELEKAIRIALAIPSARPGGGRSLGTGYKLHPTFKSYMSTVRAAFDWQVELLDADGMPRSRDDITSEVEKLKPVKDPEDKVIGAVETLIKIRDACSDSDPRTVDADNMLINWLTAKGYSVTAPVAAAA